MATSKTDKALIAILVAVGLMTIEGAIIVKRVNQIVKEGLELELSAKEAGELEMAMEAAFSDMAKEDQVDE